MYSLKQVDDVVVPHPDATARGSAADRPRCVRSVNPILGPAEIDCAHAERIFGPAARIPEARDALTACAPSGSSPDCAAWIGRKCRPPTACRPSRPLRRSEGPSRFREYNRADVRTFLRRSCRVRACRPRTPVPAPPQPEDRTSPRPLRQTPENAAKKVRICPFAMSLSPSLSCGGRQRLQRPAHIRHRSATNAHCKKLS